MPLIFLLTVASFAGGIRESTGPSKPPIGSTVADFALDREPGEVRPLGDESNRRLVCVVFLRAGCPVAELYATPLAGLADRFQPRGVRFIGVSVDEEDGPAELARYATEHGIKFPLLSDRGELVAQLGATRTPEVVVLDDQRRIRYRGRIDDRYAVGSRRDEARSHDLIAALDDLLEGREVGRPETEAVGCPIPRPTAGLKPAGTEVTYCRDVAPILERRCVSCHRSGQIGPFSLTTYRGAARRAGAITEAVESGRMPPWHADPRYGKFANDGRLTDHEKRMLLDWAQGGCPEGDSADLPKPVAYPAGWRIPEPDLVVSMPAPFTVPAQGVVEYQTFEVDPGFREDRWIRAAEIRPGNRKVVHHCNVFLKAPGSHDFADSLGELGSYCLTTTTPGAPPSVFPAGMAKRIPAGWRIVFVVHYSPIGTVQVDRTSLGLRFADPATVKQEVATNLMFDLELRIPPHAANHRVEHTRRFERDVVLLAMFPHMHFRGKSFRYQAIFPDGRVETLLDVPRYDFQWQNSYELAEPKRLPAGTTLRCIAHYDNSKDNPANPDPNATVLAGPQSWEEMFNGFYDIALADQDLTRPLTRVEVLSVAAKRYSWPLVSLLACAAWSLHLWTKRNRATAVPRVDSDLSIDGFHPSTAL
ncbi:Peroxiredoxin [Singulisphaera sp. GP187]|uniref:redoxin domain-containing protein n=1 Tax=Singulisphaera sp. GP187 TaxID=1882752 RepID=UPI00092805B1|nr:redoxin domain-containing protein [Singulisphaera sp. GP187]SIO67412.1 Peroxiredoxin [Singulisphaera sp. GP187]